MKTVSTPFMEHLESCLTLTDHAVLCMERHLLALAACKRLECSTIMANAIAQGHVKDATLSNSMLESGLISGIALHMQTCYEHPWFGFVC